ncbi:unnamed protein product [Brachionus calyciflorus]|uniref:Uncharacterized protein n=1 Tax=Brachionus calyciflorus TaxID=104777 RepID=A0A813M2Q2_9BILA|nr:unnamed protein product [Brachionus calyciflorus]
MSHKINPNDNIQLLEFKLNQVLIALKKVLKWEKAIEKRIEATKLQTQALKSSKQKPMIKIPVPVPMSKSHIRFSRPYSQEIMVINNFS